MDRVELKEKAKEMIKGNLWPLWKPLLVIFAISFGVAFVLAIIVHGCGFDPDMEEALGSLGGSIISLALLPVEVGICAYYLKFVRGEELTLEVLKKYYPFFVKLILLDLLVFVFTFLWTLLLIIPGIIAAISYSMVFFIAVDKENLTARETITESKRIMQGHKLDFFILQLSFLGWILLVPFTLGILLIWLIPYITIADVLFYEEIRKKAEN